MFGLPNGLRYRRLGRTKLRNGKLLKLRNNPKKRTESQPSGARFVRRRAWYLMIDFGFIPAPTPLANQVVGAKLGWVSNFPSRCRKVVHWLVRIERRVLPVDTARELVLP